MRTRSTRSTRSTKAARTASRKLRTLPNESAKARERREAVEEIKKYVKKDDVLVTVLRHTSSSGMMRHIDVYKFTKVDKHGRASKFYLSRLAAAVLGWGEAPHGNGVKVSGAGMDMGFHLVHSLGSALFGDGYALNHEWL